MDFKDKPIRETLKGYFKRNAIPTENNFAALIESAINQKEDGIAKLPGQPLCLQPDVDDTELERVINFYKKLTDENPEWTLSLNPNATPGWSIGDADGNSKLFIDKNTGNVGIGISKPQAKLHVNGTITRVGGHFGTTTLRIEATDSNQRPAATARLELHGYAGRAKGLFLSDEDNEDKWFIGYGYFSDGVGIGYSNTGKTEYPENLKLFVGKNGSVGIGTSKPTHKFHVVAADAVGLFESSGSQAYLRLSTKEGIGNRVEITNRPGGRLSLWTAGAGDVFNILKTGNVGIGTTSPRVKLEVTGPVMARMDVIRCGNRGDWGNANHPIKQYFKKHLSGKPVGTYLRASQDHPSWRGHYWEAWVDADRRIRVTHNWRNEGNVV